MLSSIGLEPKKPRMRTMGINTEAAAAPLLTTAAATAAITRTNGCIYVTTLAGRRYHTRNNYVHIIGRNQQTYEKCLDCSRLGLTD